MSNLEIDIHDNQEGGIEIGEMSTGTVYFQDGHDTPYMVTDRYNGGERLTVRLSDGRVVSFRKWAVRKPVKFARLVIDR